MLDLLKFRQVVKPELVHDFKAETPCQALAS